MLKSLRWHVLWPVGSALLLALALAAVESYNRAQTTAHVLEASSLRDALDQSISDVQDRHIRTVRRVREAVINIRGANTVAILQWTSAMYVKDMERAVDSASKGLREAALPWADSRFSGDLERVQKQLERVTDEAQQVGPVLDALMESSNAAADPNALNDAQQGLERADRTITYLFGVTQDTMHLAIKRQMERAGAPALPVPWPMFFLLLAWVPGSLFVSARVLARVGRLGPGKALAASHTEDEARLQGLFNDCNREREEMAGRLTDRTLETERAQHLARRAEQELALLRVYNENLVNSLRSAIVVTDAAGAITSINRTARALLGLGEQDVGAPIDQRALFQAVQARSGDLPTELRTAMDERRVLRFEAVSYGEEPRTVVLDLTLAPYQDESGAARGLLWVADDVTDAVQTKHQLLLAERLAAVGRLSAQVAHEIRNPLSAIGLNAELLEEEFVTMVEPSRRDEAITLLRAIGGEIERLTEVTEAYLQLARLPRPNLRSVDVNQLVADLFVMLGEEMRTHGITVAIEPGTPPPITDVDPGQLRQALINIIRNSREAMEEGGTLKIITAQEPGGCRITVTDTGPGIPEDIALRVFEPFYSTKPQGTGLGLSLTQQIVLEHGGSIEIAANAPRGAVVVLRFPNHVAVEIEE